MAALAVASALTACGGADAPVTGSPTAQVAASQPRARILSTAAQGGSVTPQAVASTTIVVRAGSTQVDGIGAMLQLRYNGVVVAAAEVRSTGVTDHVLVVPVVVDGGLLDVVFGNASHGNGDPARRLALPQVLVNGTSFSPNGPGVSYDLGHGLEAFDGIFVVPGAAVLTSTGALRIPMPPAAALGAGRAVDGTALSPEPGPYVDIDFGADHNPGTFERPFKTLARLAQVHLLGGENIHLRCGNRWRETLALGSSTLSDGTQIVGYGQCANDGPPLVTGADSFKGGWTRDGNVWWRDVPPWTPKITRLFVHHTAMRPAQWPNAGEPQVLVRSVDAQHPWRFSAHAADARALEGVDLAGAVVMLRTQPWRIETRQVAAQGSSGTLIALATSPDSALVAGDAYLLRDKLWMLDAPGEFFHDRAASRLYLIPAAADAWRDINATEIEGSVRDHAFDLRERRRIGLKGLAARLAREDGFRLTNTPEAHISGVQATENGGAGVRVEQWLPIAPSTPGPRIEDSLVAGNGHFGIDATYVRAARVSGNRVLDTGVGVHTGPGLFSISAGPAARVEDNIVDGAAYVGIVFSSQDGSVVARNEIRNYCLRLSDCGAIYSWTGLAGVSQQQGSLVEGNRVFEAVAASEGSPLGGNDVVVGIYLDEFTQRSTVRNNFLYGMPMGIFLHNTARTTVEGNRIWLARRSALWVAMTRTDADWAVANVLQHNEIVPMTTTRGNWPELPSFDISHPVWFSHALDGQGALGAGRNAFIGNRVVQVNGVLPEHALINDRNGQRAVDAATWRQMNPADNAPERPLTIAMVYPVLGPEKLAGGHFENGLGSWSRFWNWQRGASSYDVQSVLGQAGCTSRCIRMTVAERDESIFSPAFSMRPGVPHLYRWTAVATAAGAVVGVPFISQYNSPWQQLQDARGFVTLDSRDVKAGQTQHFEALFTPRLADNARVNLQLETVGVPIHFDDVSIREVLGWWTSGPAQWAAPVIAPRDQPRTVASCAEFGWPSDCRLVRLDGTPLTLPLTVAAGTQDLLLWADSPFRR